MSRPELSLFSYEVMGLVGRDGRRPARPAADGAPRPHPRLGGREPVLRRAEAAREAGLPRGPPGARPHPPADRLLAHRPGPRGAARVGGHAGDGHAAEVRAAAAAADRRPRGGGRHARGLATLREDLADLSAAPRRERGRRRGAAAPRAVPARRQRLPARVRRRSTRSSSTRFQHQVERRLGGAADRAEAGLGSTSRSRASPACVPSPARPGCESEPGVQHSVENP